MLVKQKVTPAGSSSQKLFYVDNIKIFMTALVIMHHAAVTYGAPGNWYYNEKTTSSAAIVLFTMFVSVNQSFFMGFFFLLAAFFTPGSYERKSTGKFIADRALRLGVPLVFYSCILSPLLSYLVYYFAKGNHITYLQYLCGFDSWIDFGVLWFVAALVVFTGVYVIWRQIFNVSATAFPVPGKLHIFLLGLILGAISFLVRIVFPVGWVLKPLGFQLGHFPQYIAFFIIGLLAFNNGWLKKLLAETGTSFKKYVIALLFIFPVFYLIKYIYNVPLGWFSGGYHWQSLLYALWEQTIGISIVIMLLVMGKIYFNRTSSTLVRLSRCTFAVYIFHPLVIISLSIAVRNLGIDPAFQIFACCSVGCFRELHSWSYCSINSRREKDCVRWNKRKTYRTKADY